MQQYFGVKKENDKIYLNNKDFNHVKNVMRMKEGTKVYVVIDGVRYLGSINKDLESVSVIQELKSNIKNKYTLIYVPLLNDEKMSYIFQKCTELGSSEFVVVNYERCKYKLSKDKIEKKLERWNKIITEASEQSYRIKKPKLEKIIDYKDIKSVNGVNMLCSLDTNDVKSFTDVLTEKSICDRISIAFGPEGGLTQKEEDIISSKDFIKISLGSSVLRTETVPIFLMSIVKYLRGCE